MWVTELFWSVNELTRSGSNINLLVKWKAASEVAPYSAKYNKIITIIRLIIIVFLSTVYYIFPRVRFNTHAHT